MLISNCGRENLGSAGTNNGILLAAGHLHQPIVVAALVRMFSLLFTQLFPSERPPQSWFALP